MGKNDKIIGIKIKDRNHEIIAQALTHKF